MLHILFYRIKMFIFFNLALWNCILLIQNVKSDHIQRDFTITNGLVDYNNSNTSTVLQRNEYETPITNENVSYIMTDSMESVVQSIVTECVGSSESCSFDSSNKGSEDTCYENSSNGSASIRIPDYIYAGSSSGSLISSVWIPKTTNISSEVVAEPKQDGKSTNKSKKNIIQSIALGTIALMIIASIFAYITGRSHWIRSSKLFSPQSIHQDTSTLPSKQDHKSDISHGSRDIRPGSLTYHERSSIQSRSPELSSGYKQPTSPYLQSYKIQLYPTTISSPIQEDRNLHFTDMHEASEYEF